MLRKRNMKKIKLLVLSPLYILLLSGCSLFNISNNKDNSYSSTHSSIESESQTSEKSSESSETISSSSSSKEEEESLTSDTSYVDDDHPALESSAEYYQFWDSTTELHFNISISQEAINFINQYQCNHNDSTYFDYYVPCDLTLTMNDTLYEFEEVGIRQKGNMSRTNVLVDNDFSLDSLGHYKLSFKQTFDGEEYDNIPMLTQFKHTWNDTAERKARKNRTLFDMEKIDIKWNRNKDESKSKQSYMLKTFRDMGVIAGNDTLADTTFGIKGKDTSINTTYEILECIDEVFIKRHFNQEYASGDLYKCAYQNAPANFSSSYTVGNQIGVEDNVNNYHPAYDLKTNKKKSKHENLLNLIKIMNDKTSSADVYHKNISDVMNMTSFMMYESIAFLCGNFDDLRNNANNYYLYFTSTTNYAYIIPYDFDRGLGCGCEGRQQYMTNFSAESTKMQCSNQWQTLNIYWRTVCTSSDKSSGHANVQRVEFYRNMYQSNIETLLNTGKISYESFKDYVNSFPASYRGNPDGAGDGNTTFQDYLTRKIKAIKDNNKNYDIKVS